MINWKTFHFWPPSGFMLACVLLSRWTCIGHLCKWTISSCYHILSPAICQSYWWMPSLQEIFNIFNQATIHGELGLPIVFIYQITYLSDGFLKILFGKYYPDNKVHGANMGPNWVLSAPDGPHAGPMHLAIRVGFSKCSFYFPNILCTEHQYGTHRSVWWMGSKWFHSLCWRDIIVCHSGRDLIIEIKTYWKQMSHSVYICFVITAVTYLLFICATFITYFCETTRHVSYEALYVTGTYDIVLNNSNLLKFA